MGDGAFLEKGPFSLPPNPLPSSSKDFRVYRIPHHGFPLRLYAEKSRFPYPVSKKYTSLTYTLTIEPCRNAEQGLGNVKSLWEGWGWLGGGGEDFLKKVLPAPSNFFNLYRSTPGRSWQRTRMSRPPRPYSSSVAKSWASVTSISGDAEAKAACPRRSPHASALASSSV